MPFEKGRKKTGGRTKGSAARKSTRLIDQLRLNGFNFPRELAQILKDLKDVSDSITGDAAQDAVAYKRASEKKYFYGEMKNLLPYMAPKLREKDIELVDDEPNAQTPAAQNAARVITDEELLRTLEHGKPKQPDTKPSNSAPVAKGRPQLQAAPSPEVDLRDMAGEQKDH